MNETKSDFSINTTRRQLALRLWMYQNNITWGDFGRHLGISAAAAMKALVKERCPVRHYNVLVNAYPDLPRELLPEARDVPPGPKPQLLKEASLV